MPIALNLKYKFNFAPIPYFTKKHHIVNSFTKNILICSHLILILYFSCRKQASGILYQSYDKQAVSRAEKHCHCWRFQ